MCVWVDVAVVHDVVVDVVVMVDVTDEVDVVVMVLLTVLVNVELTVEVDVVVPVVVGGGKSTVMLFLVCIIGWELGHVPLPKRPNKYNPVPPATATSVWLCTMTIFVSSLARTNLAKMFINMYQEKCVLFFHYLIIFLTLNWYS